MINFLLNFFRWSDEDFIHPFSQVRFSISQSHPPLESCSSQLRPCLYPLRVLSEKRSWRFYAEGFQEIEKMKSDSAFSQDIPEKTEKDVLTRLFSPGEISLQERLGLERSRREGERMRKEEGRWMELMKVQIKIQLQMLVEPDMLNIDAEETSGEDTALISVCYNTAQGRIFEALLRVLEYSLPLGLNLGKFVFSIQF